MRWLHNFITRWKNRKRLKSRGLIRYWDGRAWRYGDPWRIYRALSNHPTVNLADAAVSAENGEEPVTTQLVEAVSEAFAVTRCDATGNGLTDDEVLCLLWSLVDWIEYVKKNSSRGQTSVAPTD